YYFRRSALSYSSLYSSWEGHVEYQDRWQKPGDENHTQVPSMVYPANGNRDRFYEYSEVTVGRGDHIRLQYVNLSYDLPIKKIMQFGIRQFQVYVNANNLGILGKANH